MKKTATIFANGVEATFVTDPVPAQLPVLSNPLARACNHLLSLQKRNGNWEAPFQMDVRQTSEYIFLQHIIREVDEEEQQRMLDYIIKMEMPGGGWNIYHGGPPDVSTTATAYYALRLGGFAKDHPVLIRAREVILSQGGLLQANCFTRGYFMLFGQMHRGSLPAMPVEIMLLPKWFPFNLYAISSWSRAIMVPLFIINAVWNKSMVTPGPSCEELLLESDQRDKLPQKWTKKWLTWHNFFLAVTKAIQIYEKFPIKWLRKWALNRAHKWVAEHMGRPGGVSAIFPSMVNSYLALYYMGYEKDHPLLRNELRAIKELRVDDEEGSWIQPCFSTVWDTSWCLRVLPHLGLSPQDPALVKTKEFLLAKQVGVTGDWQEKIPAIPCGGWYFQRENSLYPDTDDTAAALIALAPYKNEERVESAARRAIRWLFAMQSKNGGWAAFDYQARVYECFNYIPFAEHGALLDPPTADVTARVIEALAEWGYGINDPNILRAVQWLLEQQEEDGSWFGRWGVNYVYGTWAVLCGLEAVGFDMAKAPVRRAVRWLLNHQRPDGGWGESCGSYTNPGQKAQGESTPSQTSWALMALAAAGEYEHQSVSKGVDYLLSNQLPNGSWKEEIYTGTGFPGVTYLLYHLYRDNFPAMALAKLAEKIDI